jgi:DNA polymerase
MAPRRTGPASPSRPDGPPPPAPEPPAPRPTPPAPRDPALDLPEPLRDKFIALQREAVACTACALHKTRTNVVYGVGSPAAPLLFVGEAPGADEDRLGEPFVGRAGQLLTRALEQLGVRRDQVYIANVLKCRPPGNRKPEPEEIAQCFPYLRRQIEIIRPKVLCALGAVAAQTLLGTSDSISKIRGRFFDYAWIRGIRVLPTFHPAYLLRSPWETPKFKQDLRRVLIEVQLIRPA